MRMEEVRDANNEILPRKRCEAYGKAEKDIVYDSNSVYDNNDIADTFICSR